jgi:hypothetical protein
MVNIHITCNFSHSTKAFSDKLTMEQCQCSDIFVQLMIVSFMFNYKMCTHFNRPLRKILIRQQLVCRMVSANICTEWLFV